MVGPVLSLPEYSELVADLPAPTQEQMQAFAEFVSEAHSWYKHLPLLPPGRPFQFFLDPSAGLQRVGTLDGRIRAVVREERGFHYSWLPTREYRDRFGYLAFSQSSGTSVALVAPDGNQLIGSDDASAVHDPGTGRLLHLPGEALEAGQAWLSGIVHTSGSDHRIWQRVLAGRGEIDWPEESGGRAAFSGIVERCRELGEDPSRIARRKPGPFEPGLRNLSAVDFPLYQLLARERSRQQRHMVRAMERVARLVGKSAA
jgi:hypothetical protein